jgi:hypothetical protein
VDEQPHRKRWSSRLCLVQRLNRCVYVSDHPCLVYSLRNQLPFNVENEAHALAVGQVIREQSFVVPARSTDWVAFVFPVDRPFRIHAWGEMQPAEPKTKYQALVGRLCDVDEKCSAPSHPARRDPARSGPSPAG